MFTNRRRFFISSCVAIVTILAACQSQPTAAPAPALPLTATVKEITGTVTIKQPGASGFTPASLGAQLQVNGVVQTGEDGRARLDLSTGTIIRVAPSSLFTLTSNQPAGGSLSTQLTLGAGGVFVILNGGSTTVNTPSGVASVRGSYLSVFVDPATQSVVVTCLEGSCGAGNSAGNTDFGTGQAVTLFSCTAGQCTVPNVGPMTPQEFQLWFENNPDLQQIPGLAATMTALAAPPPAAPAAPIDTPTFTATAETCLDVLGPNTGADLGAGGPVSFSWKPKPGAGKYQLNIVYPGGQSASFYTDKTSITRYLESMPDGGTYTWDVTVFDNSGQPICRTPESTFSKVRFETPVPRHLVCTQQNFQTSNPNKPCYCNPNGYNQMPPPYCPLG